MGLLIFLGCGFGILAFVIMLILLINQTSDWEVVIAKQGVWYYNKNSVNNPPDNYCLFEILYSESLNKYRLKCTGYKPKQHDYYPKAIENTRVLNRDNKE